MIPKLEDNPPGTLFKEKGIVFFSSTIISLCTVKKPVLVETLVPVVEREKKNQRMYNRGKLVAFTFGY